VLHTYIQIILTVPCDSVAVYAVSRQCGQGKCARQRPTVLVWGFILIIKRSLKQSRKIVATLPDTVEKMDTARSVRDSADIGLLQIRYVHRSSPAIGSFFGSSIDKRMVVCTCNDVTLLLAIHQYGGCVVRIVHGWCIRHKYLFRQFSAFPVITGRIYRYTRGIVFGVTDLSPDQIHLIFIRHNEVRPARMLTHTMAAMAGLNRWRYMQLPVPDLGNNEFHRMNSCFFKYIFLCPVAHLPDNGRRKLCIYRST